MFALREFLLCEKEKAKAFSSCQPPNLEVLGNKASSSTYYPQKIPQSNCFKTLKKTLKSAIGMEPCRDQTVYSCKAGQSSEQPNGPQELAPL